MPSGMPRKSPLKRERGLTGFKKSNQEIHHSTYSLYHPELYYCFD